MSMSPKIMKRYIRLSTAHKIWSALSKAFYDGSDELQVFTLNQKAFTARQSGKSLSEYYGELTEIFCELDQRDKVSMKDPDDVETYQGSIQRLRVHIFLSGLDGIFEQIRGEILRKEPIPDLEECYALVRREALRHASLKMEPEHADSSAMVVRNRSTQNWQHRSKTDHAKTTSSDKSSYKCTHCNQNGHTKDRCFELVGYPEWWDHNRDSRKKNSNKNPTVATIESKSEDSAIERQSALVTATNFVGHSNQADDWLWY
ncbi:uncharacterized protein LOC114915276 [Cajanus cajan]|uniref:uncharacterized protein LOC114915275 n=1 Tax=Cajanus cajan TaxID=3821 RepID=UPI0010FAFCBE|nr:uncharacterized protein LOC114915275 [Cajanus cajan]XP_029125593.1 uncharacterized protein LOC114915276 [Cajanus cajan]